MKKAYISCPMSVSQQILNKVSELVTNSGVIPHYWIKGNSYDEKAYHEFINSCDAFVIILPKVAWLSTLSSMTSGSRRELMHAIRSNVPIFIAYENKNDGMGIYSVEIMWDLDCVKAISGIASTRFNFIDLIGHGAKLVQNPYKYKDQLKKEALAQAYGGASNTLQEKFEKYWEDERRQQQSGLPMSIPKVQSKNPIDILKAFEQTGMLLLGNKDQSSVTIIEMRDQRLNLFF